MLFRSTKRAPLGGDSETRTSERPGRCDLGKPTGSPGKLERGAFPQYWLFPAIPCRRAVNQKGREFVVGLFGSSGRIRTYNPSVNSRMPLFSNLLPALSQQHVPRDSGNLHHHIPAARRVQPPRLLITAGNSENPCPLPLLRCQTISALEARWGSALKVPTHTHRMRGPWFTTGAPRAEIPRIIAPGATRILVPYRRGSTGTG